mmetsp:Transcript_12050/g.33368  ORF Transcript_12050/g.33368 Transcript_12050/m.33368 type:complete len:250 (-) Transcript_12050:94-843(-)
MPRAPRGVADEEHLLRRPPRLGERQGSGEGTGPRDLKFVRFDLSFFFFLLSGLASLWAVVLLVPKQGGSPRTRPPLRRRNLARVQSPLHRSDGPSLLPLLLLGPVRPPPLHFARTKQADQASEAAQHPRPRRVPLPNIGAHRHRLAALRPWVHHRNILEVRPLPVNMHQSERCQNSSRMGLQHRGVPPNREVLDGSPSPSLSKEMAHSLVHGHIAVRLTPRRLGRGTLVGLPLVRAARERPHGHLRALG